MTPCVGRHSRATPCRQRLAVRDRGRHPAARAARARMGFDRGPNGFQPRPEWVSTAIGIACGSYRPRLGRAKINSAKINSAGINTASINTANINSAGINSSVIVSGWSLDRGLVGASRPRQEIRRRRRAPGLSARAAASRRSSRPASSAYRPRPAGFQRSPPARRRGRRAAPRRGRAARPRPGGGS